jgi:hypothetical protein
VNTNAKFDLTVRRHYAVAFGHTPLDFGCTSQGIDYAAELDQQAIASGLDDAPAVFADFWVNQFTPMRFSRASVPSSLAPMSRLYPATSAARMAASLRSTRSVAKAALPTAWAE